MTPPDTSTQPVSGTSVSPGSIQSGHHSRTNLSVGDGQIFGSFWIDASEFALPVSAIREVVNEPKVVSQVPLAPPFLMGLFNLRGMIVPIIDLRVLLELPNRDDERVAADSRKVAIVENGDRCVGILFDNPGEILNEPRSARVDFRANDGGVKDVVIEGVLKLDNGNRMVQILEPYELLDIERVPQAEVAEKKTDQKGDLGKRLSCISFQLGHTSCAFDLRHVQEVRDMPKVEKSLLAHGYVIGTTNLRGDIIPVVDFRSFMGNEPAYQLSDEALSKRKLLVMLCEGGPIGLMVYSIESIIPFFENEVMPFAKLALPRGEVVKGCLVRGNEQLVMLLDHDLLLSDPGLRGPAKTCREIHHPNQKTEETAKSVKALERRTFILFSISSCFAMDTCHVSEVINRPEQLLEPPYALDFVEGILNLRGELITLINLRLLYGLKPCERSEQKVLIFKHGTQKYGILVDSVDEIVMTTSESVSNDRGSGYDDTVSIAAEDVNGVLQVTREGESNFMVMIMDVQSLIKRCVGSLNTDVSVAQNPEGKSNGSANAPGHQPKRLN